MTEGSGWPSPAPAVPWCRAAEVFGGDGDFCPSDCCSPHVGSTTDGLRSALVCCVSAQLPRPRKGAGRAFLEALGLGLGTKEALPAAWPAGTWCSSIFKCLLLSLFKGPLRVLDAVGRSLERHCGHT